MFRPLTAATLTVLAMTVPAWADTHIAYVDDAGRPATQLYVKDGKVRLETGGDAILYDAAADRFPMLDGERHSYVVMDAERMERMVAGAKQAREQMAASMAQMREQMTGMPPEQRAMMEQMMGGLGGAGEPTAPMTPPKVEIKDVGSTQKVAGFRCKDVRMLVGGRAAARMCVADLEALDIPAADRVTLGAMHEGMQKMAAMDPTGSAALDIMPQGLALKYEPQGPAAESGEGPEALQSISHGAVQADLFAVPPGYTEEVMPDAGFE
jgi:hypothetical protein